MARLTNTDREHLLESTRGVQNDPRLLAIATLLFALPAGALKSTDVAGTLNGESITVAEVDAALDGALARQWSEIDRIVRASAEALCAEHELNRNALYQVAHRARRRLRELILAEIRNTVTTEREFDQESKLVVARLLEAYGQVFAEDGGG